MCQMCIPTKATATDSHIANVDTDAQIIDTVELIELEDNQEYYLRSALVETTMNSGNYGNAFVDASGKTVQGMGWRKEGKRKSIPKMYSKMPKTCPTLPKILPKISPSCQKLNFWHFLFYFWHLLNHFCQLKSLSLHSSSPPEFPSQKLPKILPKTPPFCQKLNFWHSHNIF